MLVVVPIAVAAAEATGTSFHAVLMVVAIAGSAALLTPISTPANMMIMSPAGYRFGDYWKLGLPVMGWWLVVAPDRGAAGLEAAAWRASRAFSPTAPSGLGGGESLSTPAVVRTERSELFAARSSLFATACCSSPPAARRGTSAMRSARRS